MKKEETFYKCGSPFVRGLFHGKYQHLLFKLNQGMAILHHQHIYYKGAPQERIKQCIGAHKSAMSLTRIKLGWGW